MLPFLAYQHRHYKRLGELSIPLNDAGFVYGATITDQCRTYHGTPFRLNDHVARFYRACELAQIELLLPQDEIRQIISRILHENCQHFPDVPEWTLVWLATPGAIGSFLGLPGGVEDAQPQFIAYCFPLPLQRFASYYRTGAQVLLYDPVHQLDDCPVPKAALEHVGQRLPVPDAYPIHLKHRSRIAWWIADKSVRNLVPHAQALWLDAQGCLTETSMANIVLIRDGCLLTPRRRNVFQGISLQVTRELCLELKIPFDEADFHAKSLASVSAAFLCSTPYGIAPIGNLNGQPLPLTHPLFERVLSGWNTLVGLDLRQQFLDAVQ